jgi:hypothetical protein
LTLSAYIFKTEIGSTVDVEHIPSHENVCQYHQS